MLICEFCPIQAVVDRNLIIRRLRHQRSIVSGEFLWLISELVIMNGSRHANSCKHHVTPSLLEDEAQRIQYLKLSNLYSSDEHVSIASQHSYFCPTDFTLEWEASSTFWSLMSYASCEYTRYTRSITKVKNFNLFQRKRAWFNRAKSLQFSYCCLF